MPFHEWELKQVAFGCYLTFAGGEIKGSNGLMRYLIFSRPQDRIKTRSKRNIEA